MRTPPRFPRRRLALPAGALPLSVAAAAPSPAAAAGRPFHVRGERLARDPAHRTVEPLVANRGRACANATAGLPGLTTPLPLLQATALSAATQRTGPADRTDLQQAVAVAGVADLRVGGLASLGLSLPLDQIPLPAQLQSVPVDISAATGLLNPVLLLAGAPPLPTTLTVDISAAVRELVKLPSADLLSIKAASALAGAACAAGKPVTAGQGTVAGVTVLGNAVDVDTFGDQPIIDTQMIDLSQIDLTKVRIPALDGLTGGLLSTVLAQITPIVAATIRALPPVALPIDLLRVSVRPGSQVKTADTLTQTALEVKVTALGQNVVDLVLGEAKVGTAGTDCTPPGTAETLEKGAITGVADKRFAGRFVTIRFEADGRAAGRALVASNGTFETTVPLPAARLRRSNRARYQAVLGAEKSLNLKLERRMYVDRLTARQGRVTIAGRVTRPLGVPAQSITLARRVSCTRSAVVARFKPRADGRFSVTVDAPKGQTAAVYRLGTKVRKTARNRKLFETFTLPRGVDLAQ